MKEENSYDVDEISEPSGQDPEPTEEGSPIPDPERENGGDADDVPGAV